MTIEHNLRMQESLKYYGAESHDVFKNLNLAAGSPSGNAIPVMVTKWAGSILSQFLLWKIRLGSDSDEWSKRLP